MYDIHCAKEEEHINSRYVAYGNCTFTAYLLSCIKMRHLTLSWLAVLHR